MNASQQHQFRRSTDARIHSKRHSSLGVVPNMIFGEQTSPATPMHAVICNLFGESASVMKHRQYSQEPVGRQNWEPRQTKWSALMKEQKKTTEPANKPLFKMKKFLKVEPRTETRRV